jgi:hypothetical protein
MVDEARRRGLLGWLRYAEWFSQALQLEIAADRTRHVREVAAAFAAYDEPRREMLATFCTDWVDDALIARVTRGGAPWVAAEVQRVAGVREEGCGRKKEAERNYQRAIEKARHQGAMAWELRAALSLAKLWASMQKPQEAVQLLAETCRRAEPGNGSAVFREARLLCEQLAASGSAIDRTAGVA